MRTQERRPIPMYALLLVFLASFMTNATYRGLPYLGINLEKGFPTGFVVYVLFVWVNVSIVVSILKRRGWRMSDIGLKRPNANMMLTGLLFLAIGMVVVFPGSMLINRTLGIEMKGLDYAVDDLRDVLVAIIACSATGPLGEEILFRGFLIKVAQQKIGKKWLVGLLALLAFAVIHFPFGAAGVLFITLWAILPIFLFLYYDNIYPGYLMHALGNLWAFLLVPILFRS